VLRPEAGVALAQPRGAKPDDPAYVLFTSGSTGPPKGVPVLHRNTAHYFGLFDAEYDFGPRDVFSQTFDLTFDCAMFDLFNAWGAGACVVPVELGELRRLPWFAAEHGLTVWFSVPSCIGFVRRAGALSAGGLPGLRWSGFIGEPLHCDDARDWQAAAPRSVVENVYGPTELTISISTHRWSGAASRERSVNGVVPIGAVHAGHDYVLAGPEDGDGVTVLPPEDGQPVDGELCVTGPQMFAGYLDPRDDDGRFLHHDGRRWYRTGDVVRRYSGGELAYVGRADDQVQLAGMRVELSEVSNALRSCPGVLDAAAVAPMVGGEPRLVAFHTGEPVPAVELAGHLKRLLPRGMLPRRYLHVDEFPLNANRKVDRNALRERAAAILTGAGEQP
jgi:acyl-CoA synthetase (AMP-forming)/AMP-acid ligase II